MSSGELQGDSTTVQSQSKWKTKFLDKTRSLLDENIDVEIITSSIVCCQNDDICKAVQNEITNVGDAYGLHCGGMWMFVLFFFTLWVSL